MIRINPRYCKRCDLCVHFCPKNVLEAASDRNAVPSIVRAEKCTACRICELYCPDFAISIEP